MIVPQRQAAHQPLLLLEIQLFQYAVVLLRDGVGLKHIVVELLLGVRGVQQQKGHEEHTLVAALQLLQELLRLLAVGGKVGGDNVHIIARADRLFLFLDGHFLQVCDLPLDGLDGLDLIDGLDVHGYHKGVVHIQKVRQQPVIQLRREYLQKGHAAEFLPDAEVVAVSELKGAGGDEVLDGQACGGEPVPGKAERFAVPDMEHPMQELQPFHAVHRLGLDAQPLEVVEYIGLNALQPGLGRFQAVRLDAKGQILGFHQAVVAAGELVLEHFGVLPADAVKGVAFRGNGNAFRGALPVGGQVHERELETDGRVEVVEEIAPAVEDRHLVLVLVELIVDVLKLHRFRVAVVRHAADAVREHPLKRDAVLGRLLLFIRALCPCDGRVDLFSFRSCELSWR